MLLHDLYETKMCNSMLFPESDEDIWKHEDVQISVSPLGVHISKGDSKGKKVKVYTWFKPIVTFLTPRVNAVQLNCGAITL